MAAYEYFLPIKTGKTGKTMLKITNILMKDHKKFHK